MLARIIALVALLLAPSLAWGQASTLPGFPPGTFQSRAALDASPAASYTGPGDTVSGALMFVGLTAYNAAYAAPGNNPSADICDSATMTTCVTVNILTTGYFDVATASGSAACAVACSVKKLYDQTGHGNDYNTSAGNLVFFAPALTFNCSGSLPCIAPTSHTEMDQALATSSTAQPFTLERVSFVTANTAQFITYPTNNVQATTGTNLAGCFAGSSATGTASDSTWHLINVVFNGASSDIHVDSTTNTGDCGTSAAEALAGTPTFPTGSFSTLKVMEFGFWPSAISAANSNTISTKRKSVYGY